MKTLLPALFLISLAAAQPANFSGRAALQETAAAVKFGPRPAGSEALAKLRDQIRERLQKLPCQLGEDAFTARTPIGPVRMKNIIARFGTGSDQIVVVSGHYDTKAIPGVRFVGANDGGSSTGFLLELARVLASMQLRNPVWLVWLDGEEAFGEWSDTNGTYGSRHLAAKWAGDGTLGRIHALINVDMIGDRDLGILNDSNSSPRLHRIIWSIADRLGFSRHFLFREGSILDDHIPFRMRGVDAVDLIDFSYGPDNRWWHDEADTMDKLDAASFEIVGKVVVETIKALEE